MKEQPIIFSAHTVNAILEGRKSQTRRVVTPKTSEVGEGWVDWAKFCWDGSQIYRDTCIHGHTEVHKAPLPFVDGKANEYYPYEHQYLHVPYNWTEDMTIFRIYPRWNVGDKLWVRETFCETSNGIVYRASETPYEIGADGVGIYSYHKWLPSIFMPRWASRITLEITGIRVERLQEITRKGAIAEGYPYLDSNVPFSEAGYDSHGLTMRSEIDWFHKLWNSLNAKRGYPWESNPWVWVIEFRKMGAN